MIGKLLEILFNFILNLFKKFKLINMEIKIIKFWYFRNMYYLAWYFENVFISFNFIYLYNNLTGNATA